MCAGSDYSAGGRTSRRREQQRRLLLVAAEFIVTRNRSRCSIIVAVTAHGDRAGQRVITLILEAPTCLAPPIDDRSTQYVLRFVNIFRSSAVPGWNKRKTTPYIGSLQNEKALSLSLTSTANKKTSTKVLFTQSYGKRIVPPWTIPPSDISSYHARLWLELEVGLVGLGLVGLSLWFGLGGTVREGNCQGECPTLNRITLLTSRRYLIPRTLAPPLDTCPRGQTVYAAECKRNIK